MSDEIGGGSKGIPLATLRIDDLLSLLSAGMAPGAAEDMRKRYERTVSAGELMLILTVQNGLNISLLETLVALAADEPRDIRVLLEQVQAGVRDLGTRIGALVNPVPPRGEGRHG